MGSVRRLSAADRLLLVGLLAIWCVVFALHVREIRRVGAVQVPVFAAPGEGADAYPTVGGFRLERDTSGTQLEVGDRLLRIGDRDLKGAGYFGFDAIAFEAAGTSLELPLVFERAGERCETTLRMRPSESPWARVGFSLSFAAIAVLVLLRAPGSPASRWFFAGWIGFAIFETPFEGGPRLQTYAAYTVFYLGGPAAIYCVLRWLILFPEEVAKRDRLSTAWAWIALLFPLARLNYVFGGPFTPHLVPRLVLLSDLILFTTFVGILTHDYSKADPVGRRRVKWVLYGAYLAFLPVLFSLLEPFLGLDFVRFDQLMNLSTLLGLMLPLALLVAILRYRLFDIDRMISVTLSCTLLVAVVIGAIATIIPPVARAAGSFVGIEPQTGQMALSALLAAAAIPIHQWLRPQVDRLFFSQRHALETGVRELLTELSSCAGPQELAQRLGERLATLLRPESCTVYSREGDNFAPIFVRGQSVPPEFPVGSPLVVAVEGLAGVALADSRSARRGGSELGPFERAAFETLGAAVVVPIRPRSKLAAFLCLGLKRSGDIYTRTDFTLLSVLAEKGAAELQRHGDDELIRHERALQQELRKYVPGAIADQIETGGELEARAREVSVLFVDIRGYTTYAEGRQAGEIFSVINRYTENVSSLVREYGGSVVEFNGDGMMAVFGAPEVLPQKERAAVETACAIADSMESVSEEGEPLSVGIGIATGEAFVGNIRAADRMIWSAIGNTTNLAARLQSLSRDLKAFVVVDHATWNVAGSARRGFVLHGDTRIRGRDKPEDVYALPLDV